MRALLDDIAILQHQNAVGVFDGGKAVGDHERSSALHQLVHGFLDQDLGAGIDRAGGFVQDEDGRVSQTARAMVSSCFCPPAETLVASSFSIISYPPGSVRVK